MKLKLKYLQNKIKQIFINYIRNIKERVFQAKGKRPQVESQKDRKLEEQWKWELRFYKVFFFLL